MALRLILPEKADAAACPTLALSCARARLRFHRRKLRRQRPALLLGLVLVLAVLAAVHHAERIAHRVGEPFGTFVLAIAVTVIELGLIVTLM